tara:strand:+ start:12606 stop:13169 length:564 start_codon:yes stop_codon:yes gene_type:complete
MSIRITSGVFKGRRIKSLESKGLRPTTEKVRAAIFSILGHGQLNNAKVLDLFAGTGALGIEALSLGAKIADFVEADRRRASMIRQSLRELAVEDRCSVVTGRVEKVLGSLNKPYGFVLIGAPYDLKSWDLLMSDIDKNQLLDSEGSLVVEYRYGTDLMERYGRLFEDSKKRYGDTGLSLYKIGVAND